MFNQLIQLLGQIHPNQWSSNYAVKRLIVFECNKFLSFNLKGRRRCPVCQSVTQWPISDVLASGLANHSTLKSPPHLSVGTPSNMLSPMVVELLRKYCTPPAFMGPLRDWQKKKKRYNPLRIRTMICLSTFATLARSSRETEEVVSREMRTQITQSSGC